MDQCWEMAEVGGEDDCQEGETERFQLEGWRVGEEGMTLMVEVEKGVVEQERETEKAEEQEREAEEMAEESE